MLVLRWSAFREDCVLTCVDAGVCLHFGMGVFVRVRGGVRWYACRDCIAVRFGPPTAFPTGTVDSEDVAAEVYMLERVRGHTDFVQGLDVFIHQNPGGRPAVCIVMERFGRSLPGHRETLETPVIRIVVRGVASALSSLHEHGVIHTDVKPANILLQDVEGSPAKAILSDLGSTVQACSAEATPRPPRQSGAGNSNACVVQSASVRDREKERAIERAIDREREREKNREMIDTYVERETSLRTQSHRERPM